MHKSLSLAFVAAGALALFVASPALAQGSKITVTAPRAPVVKVVPASPSTLGKTFEASAPVSYADLNLTRYSGIMALQHRVTAEAHALCKRLNAATPLQPVDPDCLARAIRNGMRQADRAIIAASG